MPINEFSSSNNNRPIVEGLIKSIHGYSSMPNKKFGEKIPEITERINLLYLNYMDDDSAGTLFSAEDLLSLTIVQEKLQNYPRQESEKAVAEIQNIQEIFDISIAGLNTLPKNSYAEAPLLSSNWFEVIQNKAIAKDLINSTKGPDHIDKDGCPALLPAAQSGELELIQKLLLNGADVNKTDKWGHTALHIAAAAGNTEVVRFLLKSGADVNAATESGRTPLYEAVITGNLEEIKMLLNAGADPNKPMKDGDTLFIVVNSFRPKHWKLIKQLLKTKISSYEVDYSKQFNNTKLLSHALSFKGTVSVQGQKIPLEGYRTAIIVSTIVKSLSAFAESYSRGKSSVDLLVKSLKFTQDQNSIDSSQTLRHIKKGLPTVILTGYTGHAVSVLIWKDMFVLCDRSGSREPISFYRFDPKKINVSTIDLLRNVKELPEEEYRKAINVTLLQTLDLTVGPNEEAIKKLIALPLQLVGNCSWASNEGVVKAFMLLERVQDNSFEVSTKEQERAEVKQSLERDFTRWQVSQQMELLQKQVKLPTDLHIIWQSFNVLWTVEKKFPEYFDEAMKTQLKHIESLFLENKSKADHQRFRINKILCQKITHPKPLRALQAILGTLSFIFLSKAIKP